MKTMKMILAGVLLMLPLLCQAQKNLFNKYGDMKGCLLYTSPSPRD